MLMSVTNNFSGTFAFRDADQQADTSVTPPWWHVRVSAAAVHGHDIRNVAFFDWHVESVSGTNGLVNLKPYRTCMLCRFVPDSSQGRAAASPWNETG